MSKERQDKRKKNTFSSDESINKMGMQKQPISFSGKWKYVVVFGISMMAFLYFYYSYFYESNILVYINGFQAGIASFVLNIFGNDTSFTDSILSSQKGSISISRGCDGIEPISMFIIAIMIVPLSIRKKIPGLLVGALTLLALNIIRIIILFLASIHAPSLFDFLHIHGGYIIFMIITLVVWLLWLNWALKPEEGSEPNILIGNSKLAKK
ncbi:MAG: archaeosortase/exosortase family protein [Saprospiraceae bacterium]